jgi:hypothetical protein
MRHSDIYALSFSKPMNISEFMSATKNFSSSILSIQLSTKANIYNLIFICIDSVGVYGITRSTAFFSNPHHQLFRRDDVYRMHINSSLSYSPNHL